MFPSIFIGIILFTITIWTIVGNILVILAFIIDKQIRQGGMSNYLIINLALSDLLLGTSVLPFSAFYSTFQIWYFGKVFCEIWLVIDVLCSTASIWVFEFPFFLIFDLVFRSQSLLMIAFDRYIATNYPIRYRQYRHSYSLALIYISISWLVSLAICLLPTLFFEKKQAIYSKVDNRTLFISPIKYHESTRQCDLYKDLNFVVTSSLLSFYIPLVIMLFLYTKVLYAIKQQSTIRLTTSRKMKVNCHFDLETKSTNEQHSSLTDLQQIGRREISAEVRITRSLAVVIGCFIVCWLPFFTLYIIRAVCLCLSVNAIEVFIWLGYSNSSINPVLYAILNKNFRLAFKNLVLSSKKICFR